MTTKRDLEAVDFLDPFFPPLVLSLHHSFHLQMLVEHLLCTRRCSVFLPVYSLHSMFFLSGSLDTGLLWETTLSDVPK